MFKKLSLREKFDIRNELICFSNGVYDLDKDEFRSGNPDDFCFISTKINYEPLDNDDPLVKQKLIEIIDELQDIIYSEIQINTTKNIDNDTSIEVIKEDKVSHLDG